MLAKKILQYYRELEGPQKLPEDVGSMNPYQDPISFQFASRFYEKYYADDKQRVLLFGINPGRFGAGVTGVPFTDPIKLETHCNIPNDFPKRAELSSSFIYDMITAYGGPTSFYSKFFISAVSPLGYVRNGINLNYYDLKGYKNLFEDYVVGEIKKQMKMEFKRKVAFSIGKGENIKYLKWLNDRHQFFDHIIPLSHPRWVMQYRLKRKDEFINEYLEKLDDSYS